MHFRALCMVALAASHAIGHPGHDATQEAAELREFFLRNRSDLSHCAEAVRSYGIAARSIKRRVNIAQGLIKKRGLEERQLSSLGKSHESTTPYNAATDMSVIFSGNKSCVLAPEQIDGPYYVAGERVRADLVEDQKGIPLSVDLQVFDVDTCKPLSGAYLEIWHANATGVYGGVAMDGNGVGSSDKTNLNATWLRGAQKTDQDGAAQFHTIFPGFYAGRTTHIHVVVHLNATTLPNGTLMDTSAAHVGQMYFDQALITEVNKLGPYRDNRQTFITNEQDFILTAAANNSDPIMEYVLLSKGVENGLLAWLSIGVNTTYSHEIVPAVTYYENGGKPNPNAAFGPPPGGMLPPPGGVLPPPGGILP